MYPCHCSGWSVSSLFLGHSAEWLLHKRGLQAVGAFPRKHSPHFGVHSAETKTTPKRQESYQQQRRGCFSWEGMYGHVQLRTCNSPSHMTPRRDNREHNLLPNLPHYLPPPPPRPLSTRWFAFSRRRAHALLWYCLVFFRSGSQAGRCVYRCYAWRLNTHRVEKLYAPR